MKLFRNLGLAAALLLSAGCGNNSSTIGDPGNSQPITIPVLGFAAPVSKSLAVNNGGGTKGQLTAIADFNGDGLNDIAVANPSQHSISVFLNQGGGIFTVEAIYAGPGSGPLALAVGDFNKDNKPDIVCIGTNQVSFLFNTGAGQFPAHIDLLAGANNTGLTVADFDRDGNLDVAISDSIGANQLHMIFGDGTAAPVGYVAQDYSTVAGTITAPQWVIQGDFNMDGRPDLAWVSAAANYVTVWLNNPGGRATLFPSGNTINSGLNLPNNNIATCLAVGDFNFDSRPDIAVPSNITTATTAQLILNRTNGFQTMDGGQQAMSFNPTGAGVGDFNQDGILDAVFVSSNGNNGNGTGEADVFLGNGIGGYSLQNAYKGLVGQIQASVSVGDLNNDGRPDIVMAGPGAMTILINTSSFVTQ